MRGGWPATPTTTGCWSASGPRRAADERRRPLDVYRTEELAAMSRDIFDDRLGFAAARHAFVTKQRSGPPVGLTAVRRGPSLPSTAPSNATDLAG